MRSTHCTARVSAFCLAMGPASAAFAQSDPVLVTASRMEAPGLAAGATFGDFKSPSIGADGRVTFAATAGGGGTRPVWGVWVGRPSALEVLVTDDPEWPGTPPGFTWVEFTRNPDAPIIAPSGEVSLWARYQKDGGGGGPALLAGVPGDFVTLLSPEEDPPGVAPGVTFARLGDPSPNDPQYRAAEGYIAVRGLLQGPGIDPTNDSGIWMRAPGGEFALALREGDELPGGAVVPSIPEEFALAPGGDLVFRSWRAGAPIIWRFHGGELSALLASGDPAPGLPAGVTIDVITRYGIGAGGVFAAVGSLTGPGVSGDQALWTGAAEPGSPLELVVLEGDPVPGASAEWTFGGISNIHAHRPGALTFWTTLHSSAGAADRRGFWRFEDGALQPVMELGMPAPGLFGDAKIINLRSAASNVWGQMLLDVVLGGAGISDTRALYAVERDGSLIPLVREGNEIEYEPGQFDRIRQLAVSTHSGSGFFPDLPINNRGEIVFHVRLELIHAIYTMRFGCRADIDGNGVLDVFDFLAFQDLFISQDPRADFDGDGALTMFDFLAFQSEFVAGCR